VYDLVPEAAGDARCAGKQQRQHVLQRVGQVIDRPLPSGACRTPPDETTKSTLVILAGAADDSSILTSAPSLSVSAFTPSVEGPTVFSERANYVCTLLTSCRANARRDIYLISAEPGTPRRSDPHMPGVIEHVVLCAGRALVGVTEDPVELHPGDYITYPGDVAHVFEALDPGTVAVMVSEHG
jgi:mannose-6-phosphate isomerase-like protein (cupin superfamily)